MKTLLILALAFVLVYFIAPGFPWLPMAGAAYLLSLLVGGVIEVAKKA